jgi:hypothetical protein
MRYPNNSATVAALALLATGTLAHGQAGQLTVEFSGEIEKPALFEVYQAMFSWLFPVQGSMFSDETKDGATDFFRTTIGLDEEAADTLFPYVRDGIAQQREFSLTSVMQLCERRGEIESKAQVGDAFADIYDGLDRMQEQSWGTFEFLDDENRGILSDYAMRRASGMMFAPIDAHAAFESSPETLPELLARICDGNQRLQ